VPPGNTAEVRGTNGDGGDDRLNCSFGIDVGDGGPGTDSANQGQCETLTSVS
jgi:hypothetical protein